MPNDEKAYRVFWRPIDLDPLRQVFVHKVFKATNENTLRRLKGQGWTEESPISEDHPMGLMTKARARAYARELNNMALKRIDRHIVAWQELRKVLVKENNKLKEVIK